MARDHLLQRYPRASRPRPAQHHHHGPHQRHQHDPTHRPASLHPSSHVEKRPESGTPHQACQAPPARCSPPRDVARPFLAGVRAPVRGVSGIGVARRSPGGLTACAARLRNVSALREELGRLGSYEERHRRLLSRLALIVIATGVVDAVGSVATYVVEHSARGTDVTTFGQAVFFTTVQLLTVSSSLRNPVTPAGRVVDIVLELWAVVVVAGSAGAVATFFQSGDSA